MISILHCHDKQNSEMNPRKKMPKRIKMVIKQREKYKKNKQKRGAADKFIQKAFPLRDLITCAFGKALKHHLARSTHTTTYT